MLKLGVSYGKENNLKQPPSGGCVLKPTAFVLLPTLFIAAAFGRLCVETLSKRLNQSPIKAAAFGRLCVETVQYLMAFAKIAAAAFGRLCVETTATVPTNAQNLAAAFGRLCVETHSYAQSNNGATGSRPRAAVC